jgi:hypothetical protein
MSIHLLLVQIVCALNENEKVHDLSAVRHRGFAPAKARPRMTSGAPEGVGFQFESLTKSRYAFVSMPISNAEFEKLRKDVDSLLTTRIWVLAICGVLAALGINGQFVLNDVKDRVTTANNFPLINTGWCSSTPGLIFSSYQPSGKLPGTSGGSFMAFPF